MFDFKWRELSWVVCIDGQMWINDKLGFIVLVESSETRVIERYIDFYIDGLNEKWESKQINKGHKIYSKWMKDVEWR